MLLMPLLPAAAAPAACAGSFPVLRSVTVNQGLPYAPLVRGKDTLVRLYLSLPIGCGPGAKITTLAGKTRLAVQNSATGVTTEVAPLRTLGEISDDRIHPDRAADPIFEIPAGLLRPPSTDPFSISLVARVEYQKGTQTALVATFDTMPGGSAPITAQVNRASHVLRILAVPMGNASASYSSQFTPTTEATLAEAMRTLSRIYPVPEGVGSLGKTLEGPPPGVKYSVNPTMVDVGPFTTKWCGMGANLTAVTDKLLQQRQAWNSANVDAQADVALGVIDGNISSSSAEGCSEGMASVTSPAAWARIVPGTPSQSGAVIAMEIAHTMALVPSGRGSGWHSTATAAEGTAVDRAYHLDTRTFIADDRTVTRLTSTWHNNNTLLENLDWIYEVCKLTPQGATNAECPTAGQVGAPNSDTPMLVMSGHTDGTRPGTHVSQSYVANRGSVPLQLDDDSPYRLLQKQGTAVLRDSGVPASPDHSSHGSPDGQGPSALFAVATDFTAATTSIELVNRLTTPATVLYSATRNVKPDGDDPPWVVDVQPTPSQPRNLTGSDGVMERGPALSDDGRLIAWAQHWQLTTEVRQMFVGLVDDPSVRAPVPGCATGCTDAAWSSDGRALAFIQGSGTPSQSLSMIAVDPSVPPTDPRFFVDAAPTELYTNTSPTEVISRPTWSQGSAASPTTSIAFQRFDSIASSSRIQAVDPAPGAPTRLRDMSPPGEAASMPSWSHTAGDDRLVYVGNDELRGECSDCTLVALSPQAGTTELLVRDVDATFSAPSWGTDGHIAFAQTGPVGGSSLWLVSAGGGQRQQLTSGNEDIEPSLAGRRVAFQRPGAGDENPADLFLVDLDGGLTVGAASTSNPPEPAKLRLDLYLSCGPSSLDYPIASALTPASTAGAAATFTIDVDSSLACGSDGPAGGAARSALSVGPTVRAVVSDGFLRSDPSAPVPVDSAPKRPVAAISSPSAVGPGHVGAYPYLEQRPIRLIGSARDAEDGELEGSALEWFLDGTPVATGNEADLTPPSPGWHTLVLQAQDSDGNVAVDEHTFRVEADADGDGIPATEETCSSDADPLDAYSDSDGDGLVNIDDYVLTGEPCVLTTDYRVGAAFDPEVLNPSASGRTVTVTLDRAPRSWSEVDPATVRLHLPSAMGCPPLELPVANNGWHPGPEQATAKFDRQAVIQHLVGACGLRDRDVDITVTGTSRAQHGPWHFLAHDTFRLS